MNRTLVGIVTFGNLEFTKLSVESIRDTSREKLDFFLIVGKPGDTDTIDWVQTQPDIAYKIHDRNMGFPYSLNDIYDYAWKDNHYDYLILTGNDVIAYPNCVDSLIKLADSCNYECISALQYDVKDLCVEFSEANKYFQGSNKIFSSFGIDRPWDMFTNHNAPLGIVDMELHDIQNLCLYKKSVFEKVGYTDVGFYPAYFVDNDYARRMVISGIDCCTLTNARFFHFWSRTIHQGSGGSTDSYFKNNEKHYRLKWGGVFGKETIHPDVKIDDRIMEEQIIDHWRKA